MPVKDLIRYFNAADAAGERTLYVAGDRVEAWHGNLHLGSLFQPIVDLRAEQVMGGTDRREAFCCGCSGML